MREFLHDMDWWYLVQCVLGYGLSVVMIVGSFLLVNGIITWKMIYPLFF